MKRVCVVTSKGKKVCGIPLGTKTKRRGGPMPARSNPARRAGQRIATLLGRAPGFAHDANVYLLFPPLKGGFNLRYVVASTAYGETLLFLSDRQGRVPQPLNELRGVERYKGVDQAFRDLGYEVVRANPAPSLQGQRMSAKPLAGTYRRVNALGTATWLGTRPRNPRQNIFLLAMPTKSGGVRYRHAVASLANEDYTPGEVMVFPSDENGVITSYREIGAAYNGDVAKALLDAGYRMLPYNKSASYR